MALSKRVPLPAAHRTRPGAEVSLPLRSAKLEVIDDKAEWLRSRAQFFRKRSARLRRHTCCKNFKLGVVMAIPIIFFCIGGVLMLLNYLGMVVVDWLPFAAHPPPPPPPQVARAVAAVASQIRRASS